MSIALLIWLNFLREYNEAIEALTVLKMFNETSMAGGLQAWTLNPNFKKNYKMAVLGGYVNIYFIIMNVLIILSIGINNIGFEIFIIWYFVIWARKFYR